MIKTLFMREKTKLNLLIRFVLPKTKMNYKTDMMNFESAIIILFMAYLWLPHKHRHYRGKYNARRKSV